MHWYFEVLKKYLVLEGRASRSEYWYFVLFYSITLILAAVIDALTGTFNARLGFGWSSGAYFVLTLAPGLGVSVRRLHDIGRSGWWVLIEFIPGVGAAVLMVIALFDSQPGDNEYGPNPKIRNDSRVRGGSVKDLTGPAPRSRVGAVLRGLGFAACALLLMAGAGRYWWSQHGDQILASGKASREEGHRAGDSLDEYACVVEAVGRHKAEDDLSLTSSVSNGLWLSGCLETSLLQQTFCEGVPGKNEAIAVASWTNAECSRNAMADPYCNALFQQIPPYCSSSGRTAKRSAAARPRTEVGLAEPPNAEPSIEGAADVMPRGIHGVTLGASS
jgi:uncharacterized membrane protein YhaH (DUF805 family)